MVYRRAPLGFPPADPAEYVVLVSKSGRAFKPERLIVLSSRSQGIARVDLAGDGPVPTIVSGPPEAFAEHLNQPVMPECPFFPAGTEFRVRVWCDKSRRERLEGIVLIGVVEDAA